MVLVEGKDLLVVCRLYILLFSNGEYLMKCAFNTPMIKDIALSTMLSSRLLVNV